VNVSLQVSVVVPIFNEEKTITKVLETILEQHLVTEVVVVDDCSRDATHQRVLEFAREHPAVRLYHHEVNQGKGAALRTGFQQVHGDVVIIQDADMEYDPAEYGKVLKPILEGRADVVYGSRFTGSEAHRVLYFWHSLGNKVLTLFSNMLTNLNLTDMETGSKAFRREVLQKIQIEESRFGVEPEITAKIARLGVRIYEVSVSYYGRTYAEGKKIGWRDGVQAFWCIMKYWWKGISTPHQP
jgi:glycosyltransferase involved in cell wall biosynthesis